MNVILIKQRKYVDILSRYNTVEDNGCKFTNIEIFYVKIINVNIKKICMNVKLVLSDIDGVLTDGGFYYSEKGEIMKKFYVRDGMGITLLRNNGIPTIIVTKEKTKIIKIWCKKMKIEKIYDGVIKKEAILDKVCKIYNLNSKQIAYIGDDVNDVGLLKKVGLSATPSDASKEAKEISHYICKNNAGKGAFRELADLILANTKN